MTSSFKAEKLPGRVAFKPGRWIIYRRETQFFPEVEISFVSRIQFSFQNKSIHSNVENKSDVFMKSEKVFKLLILVSAIPKWLKQCKILFLNVNVYKCKTDNSADPQPITQ